MHNNCQLLFYMLDYSAELTENHSIITLLNPSCHCLPQLHCPAGFQTRPLSSPAPYVHLLTTRSHLDGNPTLDIQLNSIPTNSCGASSHQPGSYHHPCVSLTHQPSVTQDPVGLTNPPLDLLPQLPNCRVQGGVRILSPAHSPHLPRPKSFHTKTQAPRCHPQGPS